MRYLLVSNTIQSRVVFLGQATLLTSFVHKHFRLLTLLEKSVME